MWKHVIQSLLLFFAIQVGQLNTLLHFILFGVQFCEGLSGEDLVCKYEPEAKVVQNKHLCLPQVYLNIILRDFIGNCHQYYSRTTTSLIFPFQMKSIQLTSA